MPWGSFVYVFVNASISVQQNLEGGSVGYNHRQGHTHDKDSTITPKDKQAKSRRLSALFRHRRGRLRTDRLQARRVPGSARGGGQRDEVVQLVAHGGHLGDRDAVREGVNVARLVARQRRRQRLGRRFLAQCLDVGADVLS
jgi:hypothetical protein